MYRYSIKLDSTAREKLLMLLENPVTEKRLAARVKIILLSDRGMTVEKIAKEFHCSKRRIYNWKRRYIEGGLSGLEERKRSGRPRVISPEIVKKVINITTERGKNVSSRKMAQEIGISFATILRIWSKYAVKPIMPMKYSGSPEIPLAANRG